MNKPTIIVIGSGDVIKLSIIRSFGELGYKVVSIHLGRKQNSIIKPLDYYSKYVSSYYFINKSNLIDFLVQNCKDVKCKPILFPLDDSSVYIIDQAHHKLEKYFLYAHVNHKESGILELMDKNIQKAKALEAGLKVAKGWNIPYVNGDYIIPKEIEYPCFVKAALSYGGGKSLQRKCNNYNELRKLLDESKSSSNISFIAEEFLPVDKEIGFMGISDENKCIVPVMIEKTEIGQGTSNGVTMQGKIVFIHETDPIVQSIMTFLKNIRYVGISNFDFIESKGNLYFLEINFRYAAYGYGISSAGLNLSNLFVESICGKKMESVNISTNKELLIFNEKIGLYNFLEKFITWSKYKTLEKKSDILLVKCKDDPKPYKMFYLSVGMNFVMKCLTVMYHKFFLRHNRQ